MEAYEGGGHAYHTTMPTDALARTRDVMLETRALRLRAAHAPRRRSSARRVRALLERNGYASVAAAGFKAPCVVVSYTDDAGLQSGKTFLALGLQTAAGVPLQCDEGADFKTFRIGLFGLEKLGAHRANRGPPRRGFAGDRAGTPTGPGRRLTGPVQLVESREVVYRREVLPGKACRETRERSIEPDVGQSSGKSAAGGRRMPEQRARVLPPCCTAAGIFRHRGVRFAACAGPCPALVSAIARQCTVRGHKPIPALARLLLRMVLQDPTRMRSSGMDTVFRARPAPAVHRNAAACPAIAREQRYAAHNYDPLPVVLAHGDGCWLWDVHGRRYLDMMSAYSAVSHGHAHPRIVQALVEQAQRLAVTSRVFHNELLPAFLQRLTEVTGLDRALPANGGAEAVETALKAARKWGHKVKGIPADRAEIIVCDGQFPRPLDHDRGLLVRAAVSRWFRTVHAGFPAGSLWRCRGARARDRPRHGRVPRRADPGRRRHHRAPARLSRRVRADLPREERAPDLRRDPDRHGSHRKIPGVASTRMSGPTASFSARRWAEVCCRCRRWSAPTT